MGAQHGEGARESITDDNNNKKKNDFFKILFFFFPSDEFQIRFKFENQKQGFSSAAFDCYLINRKKHSHISYNEKIKKKKKKKKKNNGGNLILHSYAGKKK